MRVVSNTDFSFSNTSAMDLTANKWLIKKKGFFFFGGGVKQRKWSNDKQQKLITVLMNALSQNHENLAQSTDLLALIFQLNDWLIKSVKIRIQASKIVY